MTTAFNRSFDRHETPMSQLDRSFTNAEVDGTLARSLGLLPERQHQPPQIRVLPEWHVAYTHPPITSRPPMPSARRAGPSRPRPAA
jgi:hypothetical protein